MVGNRTMKVQFTGTGSILTPYLSASLCVENFLQIDVPNGFCKQVRKFGYDFSGIDVILISHFHGDHFFDIPFLLMEIGLRKKRDKPLRVLGPKGIEQEVMGLHQRAFDNWEKVSANCLLEFGTFSTNEVIQFRGSGISVEPIQVEHGPIEAWGFLISDGKASLGVTCDATLCDGVEQLVARADCIIGDASFPKDTHDHMGLETLISLANRAENRQKRFYATHLSDASRCQPLDGRICIPVDGDEFFVE